MRKYMTIIGILGALGLIILLVRYMRQTKENLTIGQHAPDFSLRDETGALHTLKDYHGKKLILYFYPKDNTPGCTQQACSLRDGYKELSDNGFTILGVSFDSPEHHARFKAQNNLPFHLLSDETKTVARRYNSIALGGLFPARKTFVIDESGIIRAIITDIELKNHADQILQILK
jgi:peroxiredoxin Q/BCP